MFGLLALQVIKMHLLAYRKADKRAIYIYKSQRKKESKTKEKLYGYYIEQ